MIVYMLLKDICGMLYLFLYIFDIMIICEVYMSKVSKFNNFFDKFVYIFLLLSPILDALTAFTAKNFNMSFSIGTIIRGLFIILSLVWLRYNSNRKKIIILFLLYVLLAIIYYFGLNRHTIFTEITNMFHIFYLPILMLLFGK